MVEWTESEVVEKLDTLRSIVNRATSYGYGYSIARGDADQESDREDCRSICRWLARFCKSHSLVQYVRPLIRLGQQGPSKPGVMMTDYLSGADCSFSECMAAIEEAAMALPEGSPESLREKSLTAHDCAMPAIFESPIWISDDSSNDAKRFDAHDWHFHGEYEYGEDFNGLEGYYMWSVVEYLFSHKTKKSWVVIEYRSHAEVDLPGDPTFRGITESAAVDWLLHAGAEPPVELTELVKTKLSELSLSPEPVPEPNEPTAINEREGIPFVGSICIDDAVELPTEPKRSNTKGEAPDGETSEEEILALLTPAVQLAWKGYLLVEPNLPANSTDDHAYQRLSEQEHALADNLPGVETWKRYVRQARKAFGEQKNQPRAAREIGGSVVRAEDI